MVAALLKRPEQIDSHAWYRDAVELSGFRTVLLTSPNPRGWLGKGFNFVNLPGEEEGRV